MALPPITYTLAVAVDGNKRTNDPNGLFTPTLNLPTPTNIRITNTEYTTITLEWDLDDPFDSDRIEIQMATGSGSTNFGPAPTSALDIAARSVIQSPLTQNTTYRFRIRTADILTGQTSIWGPIIEGTTDALSTVDDTDLDAIFYYENFQTGETDEQVSAFTNFYNASNTTSTRDIAYPNGGTRCVKTWCPTGSSGEGSWGMANHVDTPHIAEGGELWMRMGVVFPANYPFDNNQGHIPLYLLGFASLPATTMSQYLLLSIDSVTRELLVWSTWDATLRRFNASINYDTWHMVEWHITLSTNASLGKVKVWVDSTPATANAGGYEVIMQTVPVVGDYTYSVNWHGSWSPPGGYGPTQLSYGDEFAIAGKGSLFEGGTIDDTSVMETDNRGLPFIGKAVTYVDPATDPLPPTNPDPDPDPGPGPGPGLGTTDLDAMFYFDNFSSYPVGGSLENNSIYQACEWATTVTSTAYPGTTHAARSEIRKSDITYDSSGRQAGGGYGEWGFMHRTGFPKMANDNAELWIRLALYYPSSWSWSTVGSGGSIKCFRVNKVTGTSGTGDSQGYIDTYQNGNEIQCSTEYRDQSDPYNPSGNLLTGVDMPRGRWVMYECYYRLSTDYNSRRKVWIDGTKIIDYNLGIHANPSFSTSRFLHHTYWNGTPQFSGSLQQYYFSQYTIAVKGNIIDVGYRDNTPSMDRDASGDPFIGLAAK